IISISSILGLSPSPEKIIYGISKAAIINLSNSIAKEFGRYNIRANTISPGYINTDFVKDYAREMDADEYSRLLDSTQIKRVGDPEDVANLIVFLLSKKSNWITGNNIIVDGGFLL
ncbi:MAG: SDR family oxidoreductase, partial [Nanoarchaeota archaeon]|nr:SDR family oxidoreductase [Nanoarchaeota archaeon]